MFFNVSLNLSPSRIHKLGRIIVSQKKKILIDNYELCWSKSLSLITSNNSLELSQQRCYSTNPQSMPSPEQLLYPLTDDPIIIVPGIFKSMMSIYQLHAQFRKYEPDFNVPEFIDASREAVHIVSHYLSQENYEAIEGLVTDDIIQKLRQSISRLSESQKDLIAVDKKEIYAQFPYSIDMKYEGEGDNRKPMGEITMSYYSLRGLTELREKNINPPLTMGIMPEYQTKIFVANYRFRKDYSEGNEAPWIINLCNHLMLYTMGLPQGST